MTARRRKALLLVLKLVVAAALLLWVLKQVHWDDYVDRPDGGRTKSCAVVEWKGSSSGQPDQVHVVEGGLWSKQSQWRPVSEFVPTAMAQQGAPPPLRYEQVRRLGVASALQRMDPWLLGAACGLYLVSVVIMSMRFWFLLRIQEIHIRVWEVVRLVFLGQFFNVVIPGTVGGDLIKAYYVAKHTPRKAAALVTIFVDRVLGMTELTLLAVVMLTIVLVTGTVESKLLKEPIIAISVVVAVLAGALTFMLSARFRRLFHLQKLYQRLPVAHHIAAAGDAAQLYRRRIGALFKAIGVTFGSHVIWISSIAMVGYSLHLPTQFYKYFLYVPLIYIIGAFIPTPGGVGGVEALYFKAFAGVNPSLIIALALLFRVVQLVCSLPGAIVAITGPKLPKAAAIQAELGVDQ